MSDDLIERLKRIQRTLNYVRQPDQMFSDGQTIADAIEQLSRLREMTGAEPRLGTIYSLTFSDNEMPVDEDDEPLPPGTYVTVKMDDDHSWHAGKVALIPLPPPPGDKP